MTDGESGSGGENKTNAATGACRVTGVAIRLFDRVQCGDVRGRARMYTAMRRLWTSHGCSATAALDKQRICSATAALDEQRRICSATAALDEQRMQRDCGSGRVTNAARLWL